MVDGFSVLTGSVGIVGVAGGVVSTIATLRTSGAKRHVERAQGASAMLVALKELPEPEGGRLVTPGQESELRGELSRIVRENAAAYVTQNPTPVGLDFARVLMPGYFLLFAAFSVNAFFAAGDGNEDRGDLLAGGLFAAFSFVFLGITLLLLSRMSRRNTSRQLAGTPGQERYFGPIREMWDTGAGAFRKRRARQRSSGRNDPPRNGA